MKMKSLMTMSILVAAAQLAPLALGQDSDQPQKGSRHNQEERLANLSPDERQRLETARQRAMQDPAVQAANEKMKQAHKEFRDTMHAAMLKADPTIQSILDKIPEAQKARGLKR